jgi:RNA polymerase sigma factor (sigma-70 family)
MLSEATPGAEPAEPSDAELIAKVRAGEGDAYGQLFGRHHRAAVGLARRYARNGSDAEDLASEGFANVLAALQSGSGPDAFFRAYLFSSIARLAARKNVRDGRQTLSDDLTDYENPAGYTDPVLESFESKTVADSFRSLPERWQAVLWYTEIDGMSPAAVAPLLGLSANGVSALAVRAREGLRQSYLQHHITATADDPGCAAVTDKLGSYARRGLSPRNEAKVRDHLDECSKCLGLFLQVQDVGAGMRGIIFPLAAGLAFPAAAEIAAGGLFGGAVGGIQEGAARTWGWARSHALLSTSAASVAAVTVAIAVLAQFGSVGAGGGAPQVPAAQLPGNSRPTGTPLPGGGAAPDAGASPDDVPEAGLPGSPRSSDPLPRASAEEGAANEAATDLVSAPEVPASEAAVPGSAQETAGESTLQDNSAGPAPVQPAPPPVQPAPAPAPPPVPAEDTLFSASASVSRSGSEVFTDVLAISLSAVTGGTHPTDVRLVLKYHGFQTLSASGSGWQCSLRGRELVCTLPAATAGALPPVVVNGTSPVLPGFDLDITGSRITATSASY